MGAGKARAFRDEPYSKIQPSRGSQGRHGASCCGVGASLPQAPKETLHFISSAAKRRTERGSESSWLVGRSARPLSHPAAVPHCRELCAEDEKVRGDVGSHRGQEVPDTISKGAGHMPPSAPSREAPR